MTKLNSGTSETNAERTQGTNCHGSKLTVLNTRGGYLAIESSCDTCTSCCVSSLNNNRITVNCKGMWGTKWAQLTVRKHGMGQAVNRRG